LTQYRLLAAFQILGGLCASLGALILVDASQGELRFTLPLLPIVLGAASVVGGFLLFVRETAGLRLSFWVQLAQVLSFSTGWRYVFTAGPRLVWIFSNLGTGAELGFGGSGIGTTVPSDGTLLAIGASVQVHLGFFDGPLASAQWTVGLNLVAIYFAYRLYQDLRPHGGPFGLPPIVHAA
jgi:hypothetical protein